MHCLIEAIQGRTTVLMSIHHEENEAHRGCSVGQLEDLNPGSNVCWVKHGSWISAFNPHSCSLILAPGSDTPVHPVLCRAGTPSLLASAGVVAHTVIHKVFGPIDLLSPPDLTLPGYPAFSNWSEHCHLDPRTTHSEEWPGFAKAFAPHSSPLYL